MDLPPLGIIRLRIYFKDVLAVFGGKLLPQRIAERAFFNSLFNGSERVLRLSKNFRMNAFSRQWLAQHHEEIIFICQDFTAGDIKGLFTEQPDLRLQRIDERQYLRQGGKSVLY